MRPWQTEVVGGYRSWRGPVTGMTLWHVESEPGVRRILPDGVMDLMWLDGKFVFAGADTTAADSSSADGRVWGLRLAPGAAYAALGIPACELVGQRVDLRDLTTVPRLMHDSAAIDPAASLEGFFMALWEQADPDRQLVRLAASLDRAARAGLSVCEIAVEHELSERTLRRVSDRLFGYGPKTLASIHRFQRALGLARRGISLGQAAAMAGYVDQSHLNREAQRLAGTTPGALVA
jgi:AraC-like DNA-binding protein